MNRKPARIDTIIGVNSEIRGDVSLVDHSRVEGYLSGKLRSSGDIVVADTAVIEGDVISETVYVHGKISGNIYAKKSALVFKTGRVEGEIHAQEVYVEEGGIFDGKCNMIDENGKVR